MCVVPTYPESTPIFKENKKIPDYAKGYKNEYLFIRGIDKCFEFFMSILKILLMKEYQEKR